MYLIGNTPPDAPAWIVSELRKLQEAINGPVDGVVFRTLYAEPRKLQEGLAVKADGTTWNPGSGSGAYQYRGGSWQPWEGGGGGGGGGITTEQAMDAVAGMLTAGNGISLSYNDPADSLTISSTTRSLRVTVDFGAGWSDKAQTVVTGETWVTAASEITAQVLTPSGTDPDEMYLLGMRVEISNIVAGTGFTVTAYAEAEATGTYTVMVIGTI